VAHFEVWFWAKELSGHRRRAPDEIVGRQNEIARYKTKAVINPSAKTS
jgi:hypothetical protein